MDLFDAHAAASVRFAELCQGVADWDAPTPVKEWRTRDVVVHLVTWLPEMLQGYGADMERVDTKQDPTMMWIRHTEIVADFIQSHGKDRITTEEGEQKIGDVILAYYLPDIFMHQYDIAKSSGQPVGWDEETLRQTIAAVEPKAEELRASGQFGAPVILDESHSLEDRLASLIGRDPNWTPDA